MILQSPQRMFSREKRNTMDVVMVGEMQGNFRGWSIPTDRQECRIIGYVVIDVAAQIQTRGMDWMYSKSMSILHSIGAKPML